MEFAICEELYPSEAVNIRLTYTGKFKGDLEGFYQSTYAANETEYRIATTHMEPTYARQVRVRWSP